MDIKSFKPRQTVYIVGDARRPRDKFSAVKAEVAKVGRKYVTISGRWGERFREAHNRDMPYTADFRLTYADGTVEIVEIKSKFVRRMQRDYPVRRRVFLELIARPAGWKFTEIITAEDKEEIKRWRELAEEVSSCGKNG